MSDKLYERLIVIGVVIAMVAVLLLITKCDADCTAKGGVYLSREGKCVAGLREIK